MSSAGREPSNRPLPEANLEFIAYFIGIQFHPPVKLGRQDGWDLVSKLSEFIDPRGAKIEDNAWQIVQPFGDGGEFRIVVQEQGIQFDAKTPKSSPLEWFEVRCPIILEQFRERNPSRLVLGSAAKAAATLDIDGDSRDFLTTHIMHMDHRRLGPLKRPIHLLGLRLVLPAFELKEQQPSKRKKAKTVASADWQAEVKVESFAADSSKLFVEVSGQWPVGAPWDKNATDAAVGRLDKVKSFVKNDLLSTLTAEIGE
jgi:hypothetical protein